MMKNLPIERFRILALFSIVFSCFPVYTQEPQDVQEIYYNRIEPVQLQLTKYPHGSIQWQESADEGQTWLPLQGESGFTLNYSADSSSMVQANIVSGTCDTVWSQTILLNTVELRTVFPDSITDVSASIACYIDTIGVHIKEYGILISDNLVVDEQARRITYPGTDDRHYNVLADSLMAEKTYHTRAYAISHDDQYIYGNILSFSPIKISFGERVNIGPDSMEILYNVSGVSTGKVEEHGITLRMEPGTKDTLNSITGIEENESFSVVARSLVPGTDYYARAYCLINGSLYFSSERKLTSWSDYNAPADPTVIPVSVRVEWNDPSTAVKLNPAGTFGEYGRVVRAGNSDTLLLVYHGGPNSGDWHNIYLRKSFDNGASWETQEILMDLADYPGEYWRFCTPEIKMLQNGWVMIVFEANARPDENQSSVQILLSKDTGKTWMDSYIYKTGRTWEPALVQLPGGEIELFYSSEEKWWHNSPLYQDIQLIRSTDNGLTWSEPKVVAYYPEKRDGMPVPLVLQGNKGVVFAIETVNTGTSPYIIHRDMDGPWILTVSNFENSPHRWYAEGFSGHGGAPYLLQLPGGEIMLSAHIYRGGDWHQNNYQQVMIGNNEAKNFEGPTNPWGNLAWGESAVNNSLFLKNDTTVVTITTRMLSNGTGGLYWLEGTLVPK